MGDRGNVAIVQHGDGPGGGQTGMLYLYTHWGGTTLAVVVQQALQNVDSRVRWQDESKLAAIIFNALLGTAETDGEKIVAWLAGGNECLHLDISSYPILAEHPLIVLDCWEQTIGFAHPDQEPVCYQSWSFEQYVALPAQWVDGAWKLSHQEFYAREARRREERQRAEQLDLFAPAAPAGDSEDMPF